MVSIFYRIRGDNELMYAGSLARVGPNDLVTDDPDILRRMMAVRSPYTRGPWYDAMRFDPMKDNLLSMRDEEAHTALRNKMAAGVCIPYVLSSGGNAAHHVTVLGQGKRINGRHYRPTNREPSQLD